MNGHKLLTFKYYLYKNIFFNKFQSGDLKITEVMSDDKTHGSLKGYIANFYIISQAFF